MAKVTLPFFGSVAAEGELTLVSQRLNFPYTIQALIASFALGTDRTLQLHYYLSYEDSAPAAGLPTGEDLLSIYGQVPYLVGDDERKEFPHEIPVRRAGTYLKVYGYNTDTFAHTLDAQVVIES
ncbi:unnamed protein product [marine sediment metagenome]|uniref:Uncharacterized protein n=1 Tax=marine sediment metagenome TaxID=412755 RepID=X1PVG5_9ZZZZ